MKFNNSSSSSEVLENGNGSEAGQVTEVNI